MEGAGVSSSKVISTTTHLLVNKTITVTSGFKVCHGPSLEEMVALLDFYGRTRMKDRTPRILCLYFKTQLRLEPSRTKSN